MLPVDLDIGDVIFKDGWDVYLWQRYQYRSSGRQSEGLASKDAQLVLASVEARVRQSAG